ncbi:MAG: sugar transferase [Eubacteriales bacterium]
MGSSSIYKLKTRQKIYRFIKSVIDFSIALIALIVLSPLFLIVAIAIKIDSPGPVFFVQKRIGKNGKLFNCIKFRSMSVEARHDVAGYEYENVQSYVTKTGAFIRKYSIDELPQFLNILTFRMSLIGYRPSQPCENELNEARESYNVYQVRPGISGWAQVNGRDILAANPKKKAKYDAYYLEHFSLWLDIKIFFMTIVKVFKSDDVVEGVIIIPKSNSDDKLSQPVEAAESDITELTANSMLDDAETAKQKEVV